MPNKMTDASKLTAAKEPTTKTHTFSINAPRTHAHILYPYTQSTQPKRLQLIKKSSSSLLSVVCGRCIGIKNILSVDALLRPLIFALYTF